MESCNWSESLSNTHKRVFEEMIRGREYIKQLQAILKQSPAGGGGGGGDGEGGGDHGSSSYSENLVVKILESINGTLAILRNSNESTEVIDEPCGSWDGPKSEDSSESCKTFSLKDRRGCYKRRRTSETWKKETSSLIDDGHSWRKYGQKKILNTEHPRNYFRCTHKYDQGCKATKQVQMIEDHPPKYLTTYYSHHTCKNLHKTSQIILDSADDDDKNSSIFLSFGSNNSINPFPIPFPAPKQEIKEEIQALSSNNISAFDYVMQADHIPPLSSGSDDHGDVISSNFEMDMMVGSVEFDEFLFEF